MKAKILLVDDEPDITNALRDVLEMEDYEVVCAYNGEEALKKFQETKPDLVLTDIMMPVMSGLELINSIRKDLKNTTVPIILMSAGSSHMHQAEKGWNKFLKKPSDIDAILRAVSELLEK